MATRVEGSSQHSLGLNEELTSFSTYVLFVNLELHAFAQKESFLKDTYGCARTCNKEIRTR